LEEVFMKIPRRTLVLLGGLLIVFLAMAADTVVVVKIQTTAIRQNPQFFSPAPVTLKAGDKLTKISESNGWIQVKTQTGLVGWIHSSAVDVPKVNLLASNDPMKTQTKASEVALAGKGFNQQVENSYKSKHAELNFALVDRMLQVKIASNLIEAFLRQGRLGDFGGAK
jgi:hypothetical protein